MRALYPEIEPYDHGMLDVGDGQHLYWEVCGNPGGQPAVVLHGGPGSGCSSGQRRYFDPDRYRVILFDQRNCGRSTPHASQPGIDLSTNTTEHLLGDIERLRSYLGIDRWLVFGGSWGSTLALAYAEQHPECVTGLVLVGVTTTRRQEIDWLYHGLGRFFPEQWARFRDGVPPHDRDGDLVDAYHSLLMGPDPAVCSAAAQSWCDWEEAVVSVHRRHKPHPRYQSPEFRLAFARIVTHYFRHNAWLEDGILLRDASKLAAIPGVMVHGRLDLEAPLVTAWELARAWSASELVLVGGAGHAASDPGIAEAVVAATDRFGSA